jgi:hypothetical protein
LKVVSCELAGQAINKTAISVRTELINLIDWLLHSPARRKQAARADS